MISFQQLTKAYGEITAVDNLTLDIQPGEVFGLLGPNGAGKSTIVHLAAGLLTPDSGRVDIAGRGSPVDPKIRSLIGVAPQTLALYNELTGEENLIFFGKLQGMSGKNLKQKVIESLDFVELEKRSKHRVKTYSGGMKRRLNLAVALLHSPELIILDEPTAGVDPQSRNAIFENIENLRKNGATIIYTTHYMEEAQRLCDRVAIMDTGRLMALGTVPDLIAAHGGNSTVVFERDNEEIRIETEDPMAELARLHTDKSIRRFRVDSPNLEGVFLKLTGRTLRD